MLKGVSLEARRGEIVALVGPSGAGKSTLLNLIPRFYDVSGGRLRIDGTDVREVTLTSLRRQIALVTQEPFLFDDTIAANIAYSRTRPGASAAEIEVAAARAAAARVHQRAAGRVPDAGGGSGHEAVGRAETADRHRPGVPERRADPAAR